MLRYAIEVAMLWLVMVVALCAYPASSADQWDPWERSDNGGNVNKGQLNNENNRKNFAYARPQTVDTKEQNGPQTGGIPANSESIVQATNKPTTTHQVLRERFHRTLNHLNSATDAPRTSNVPKLETPKNQLLSGSDSEARSKETESNMQAALANYHFPIRARRPSLMKEMLTQTTTSAPLAPISQLNAQIVTPTSRFEATTKIDNEGEEWHRGVSMSDDEKDFLALLGSSPITQSPLENQPWTIEQPQLPISDFGSSIENDRHELYSLLQAPLTIKNRPPPPTTSTPIPQFQFANLDGNHVPLPTFVHELEEEDLETANNARNAARKHPGGGNWLVPYYPSINRRI